MKWVIVQSILLSVCLFALGCGKYSNSGTTVRSTTIGSTSMNSVTPVLNGMSTTAIGTTHWSGMANLAGVGAVQINIAFYSDGTLTLRNVTSGAASFNSTWTLSGNDTMYIAAPASSYIQTLMGIAGSVTGGTLTTTNDGNFTIEAGPP